MKKNIYTIALLLAALPFAACRTGTTARVDNAVAETSMASTGGTGTSTLTDADAGAVARTINDGEIQMAQVALTNASSQQVRDFAQMMITDHTSANQMLTSHGYGEIRNRVTEVLNADVSRRMAMLRGKTGADFDRAFIGAQIDMHQTALETLRSTLQPSAQERNLRETLNTMRTSVEMHLRQAQMMQTAMGNR